MERGISIRLAVSTGRVTASEAEVTASGGRTNAIAVAVGRSESWQQDIEQAIKSLTLWPQSMFAAGLSAAFR
jgi:hypothetical protein